MVEISQQSNEYIVSSIHVRIQRSAQVQEENPKICKTTPVYEK